jgi:CRISPR-associated protein Cas2
MFVIVVYDANEKRVNKFLKTLRKYLTWVQNSVFEGEIEEASLIKLKMELRHIMVDREDSVLIYRFRTKQYFQRESMGLEKGSSETVI